MTEHDRRAIEWDCTRLIHVYANLNDARKWAELAALFTEDGLMTRPTAPDQPIVGRATILAHLQARPPRDTRHISSNIVVTVDSAEAATAESVIALYTGTATPGGGLPLMNAAPLVGQFHDRFALTPHGWRFSERRGSLTFAA
jgi:hypothetical protein